MLKRFLCLIFIFGLTSGIFSQTLYFSDCFQDVKASSISTDTFFVDSTQSRSSQKQPPILPEDTLQSDSSTAFDQTWPYILFVHTLPKEPGSDIFQWTWNPAAIVSGLLVQSNFVIENYNLKHQIPQGGVARKFDISNRIYQAAALWGIHGFQFGLALARRFKSTKEKINFIMDAQNGEPPQSFEEVSNVFSPTVGYRMSFGLALAMRANFRNVQFTNLTPGSYARTTNHITTLDFGLEQNFGNRIFFNLFSNEVMEFINGEKLAIDNAPKYINLSGTMQWHKAWVTGGIRLTRSGSAKDSLLFLQISFRAASKFWLTASYMQSRHYPIIDMDANLAAPVVMAGGGFYYHWHKWLFTYQLRYLRFSKVTENYFAEANFLDRNHLRHELSVFWSW